jgi:hypothetical protein
VLKFIAVMIAINILIACNGAFDDGQSESGGNPTDAASAELSSSDVSSGGKFDDMDHLSSSYQALSSSDQEGGDVLSSSSVNPSSSDRKESGDPSSSSMGSISSEAGQSSSSSATESSSSSFAIGSLPAYKAEGQEAWKMKAYIVDKFGVGLCYGMPEMNFGMDDETYNGSLDEISFIEEHFSVTYERIGVSCGNGVGFCDYEYTEVDEIMRKFNEIRLVTDGEHIYAIFRDARCSSILYYQGEIISTGDGFTDHIGVVRMDTNIPC